MCHYSTATTSRPALSTSTWDPGMLNIGSLCRNYCESPLLPHSSFPGCSGSLKQSEFSDKNFGPQTQHQTHYHIIILSSYHLIILWYAAPSVGSISHPAHCSCHRNNAMLLILIFYLLDKVETNTNKSKQWIFIINLYYGLYLSVVIKQ